LQTPAPRHRASVDLVEAGPALFLYDSICAISAIEKSESFAGCVMGDNREDAATLQPVLRGIYNAHSEQSETFKNGVPRFANVDAYMEWANAHMRQGSNPMDPTLKHIFTHLVDREQVERYLTAVLRETALAKMKPERFYFERANKFQLDGEFEATRKNSVVGERLFQPVIKELDKRLSLKFHARVNRVSTVSTLNYLFNHMKCGIFVQIKNNEVNMYVPFVNKNYRNNWCEGFAMDPPSLSEYYKLKSKYYRKENILPMEQWWANGNIICNEDSRPGEKDTQYWGDNLVAPFKEMLETLCRERCVPDCEIFFNKRDHPQLKANLTEPYDFCFEEMDRPLEREKYATYAPILSFYCSEKFADLPVPTTEDWLSAIGLVFPASFIPDVRGGKIKKPSDLYLKENFDKFHVEWQEKQNTCFFRGNATGGGTTPETNQRIHLAQVCRDWDREGKNGNLKEKLLDAGFTNYNVRDKKLFGEPMRFTKKDQLGVDRSGFVDMYKQGMFKYILYVEGHCAANRYSFLMRLGSVVIKVESRCEASEMWFFPLLVPYAGSRSNNIPVEAGLEGADHVPIKADLSDLHEKILWCRENDEKCRQIAENAKLKHERWLSKDSILDYLQVVFTKVASNYEHAPSWWKLPETLQRVPQLEPPERKCARDRATRAYVHCKRCLLEIQEERKKRKSQYIPTQDTMSKRKK